MRILATLGVVLNLALCLMALLKGFYIEPTSAALAEAAQGKRMALLAVPGLIAGIVGLMRPRWTALLGGVSILLAAAAALVAVV